MDEAAQPAESGAVAWRCRFGGGKWLSTVHVATVEARRRYGGWEIEPLYLHPAPPAPDAVERARLAEQIRGYIDSSDAWLAADIGSEAELLSILAKAAEILAVPGSVGVGMTDIFEREFNGDDDPRLQVARCITIAEAEAILEHSGDMIAALATPPRGMQGETFRTARDHDLTADAATPSPSPAGSAAGQGARDG